MAQLLEGTAPSVGQFVPECEENGDFKKKQCHGSTGECWCVDVVTGEETENTRKSGGEKVNCEMTGVSFMKTCSLEGSNIQPVRKSRRNMLLRH